MAEAFAEARRRRVEVVRELSRLEIGPQDAATRDALVEALLRREQADGDVAAALPDRLARVADEAGRARRARQALGGHAEVDELLQRWDATWRDALDRCDRLTAVLRPQVAPALADAFAAYVAALREVHALDEDLHPPEAERAIDRLEEAQRRLEAAIGPA